MDEHGTKTRDIARLEVARVGRVQEIGDPLMPFRLLDYQGVEVAAVTEFLHHMLADDASPASLRSYAYELPSWYRFLQAVDVPWHHSGRVEARDFALWLKTSKKPLRGRADTRCADDSGLANAGQARIDALARVFCVAPPAAIRGEGVRDDGHDRRSRRTPGLARGAGSRTPQTRGVTVGPAAIQPPA